MPLNDQKKPLPTIVRHGVYPDTIEFSLPDGTTGFAVVMSKPVGTACDVAAALIERYNQHDSLSRDLTEALGSALEFAKQHDDTLARVRELENAMLHIKVQMYEDAEPTGTIGTILKEVLK